MFCALTVRWSVGSHAWQDMMMECGTRLLFSEYLHAVFFSALAEKVLFLTSGEILCRSMWIRCEQKISIVVLSC